MEIFFFQDSFQICTHLHKKWATSSVIIIPAIDLINRVDSKEMQQASLDIINSPDIIALTFKSFIFLPKNGMMNEIAGGLEL